MEKIGPSRRGFLLGGAATIAAVALPAVAPAQLQPFMAIDWGVQPSFTVMMRYWWDAEQEIMRVTGISAEEFYAP